MLVPEMRKPQSPRDCCAPLRLSLGCIVNVTLCAPALMPIDVGVKLKPSKLGGVVSSSARAGPAVTLRSYGTASVHRNPCLTLIHSSPRLIAAA